jgi:hypothetical protein
MWTDEELGRVFDYLMSNRAHHSPGEKPWPPVPVSILPLKMDDAQFVVLEQLQAAILNRNRRVVEAALWIAPAFGVPFPIYFNLACQLLAEDWHISHENLIGKFQDAKDPRAVPHLRKAIELKPRLEYLDYDDYGAYYKKCLWALKAIGTLEAVAVIKECANSDIEALRDEARYRMTKINT